MSYGIVRVQKFSAGSIKGIEIHDRREKDRISHTNKDINWSKTGLNYDLHPQQNTNFQKAIKLRIGQLNLPKAVRKDAVVMAQVLVTSDHYFFMDKSPEQIRGFFPTAMISWLNDTEKKILFLPSFTWMKQPLICISTLFLSLRMAVYLPKAFLPGKALLSSKLLFMRRSEKSMGC